MFAEGQPILYRELIWFTIAAPLFGAVLALIFPNTWGKKIDTNSNAQKWTLREQRTVVKHVD
jgi:hypothetical protein